MNRVLFYTRVACTFGVLWGQFQVLQAQGLPVDSVSLFQALKAPLPVATSGNTIPPTVMDSPCFNQAMEVFKNVYEREFVYKANKPFEIVNLENPESFRNSRVVYEEHMRANLQFEKVLQYLGRKNASKAQNRSMVLRNLFDAADSRIFAKRLIQKEEADFSIEDNQIYYIAQSLYKYFTALDKTIKFSRPVSYNPSLFGNTCTSGEVEIWGQHLSSNASLPPTQSLLKGGFVLLIQADGKCNCAGLGENQFNVKMEVRIAPALSPDGSKIVFNAMERTFFADLNCCDGGAIAQGAPQPTTSSQPPAIQPQPSPSNGEMPVYGEPANPQQPGIEDRAYQEEVAAYLPYDTAYNPVPLSRPLPGFTRPRHMVGIFVGAGFENQGSFTQYSGSFGVGGNFALTPVDTSGFTPALGINIFGSYSRSESGNFVSQSYGLGAHPHATLYFNGAFRNKTIAPFVRAGAQVVYGSTTSDSGASTEGKYTSNNLTIGGNLGGGLFIVIGPTAGFEVAVTGFTFNRIITEDPASGTSTEVDIYGANLNQSVLTVGFFKRID